MIQAHTKQICADHAPIRPTLNPVTFCPSWALNVATHMSVAEIVLRLGFREIAPPAIRLLAGPFKENRLR